MPDTALPPTLSNSERTRVADLLWQCITNVRSGATHYWIEQQLLHIAREVEPPAYLKNKPINAEVSP